MKNRSLLCLILFVISALLLSACGNSRTLSEEDLDQININVERLNAGDHQFQFTLSGFEDTDSPRYKSALTTLRKTRPGDVIEIIELSVAGDEDQSSPEIRAHINEPISLNRTLWAFGKKHYRDHHVDFESQLNGNEFHIMDRMPELIGGPDELQRHVRYPSALEAENIEGNVVLEFIVNEYGRAENVAVISSLHEAADTEAIRLVKKASFHPGEYDGLPVRVQITLPVRFRKS